MIARIISANDPCWERSGDHGLLDTEALCRERDELLAQRGIWEQQRIALTAEAGRYRCWHDMAKQREAVLIKRLQILDAENKTLKRELYGRKSDSAAAPAALPKKPSSRRRGQQPGNPPPPRRQQPHLPIIPERHDLVLEEQSCPSCGLAAKPTSFVDTTSVIEIHVQAHIRRITKCCYRPSCQCGVLPGIMTPTVVGALFPGSQLGVTVISELLLGKFQQGIPWTRVLAGMRLHGLDLPSSTVYGLQQPLQGLFQPLYDRIGLRNRQASHWHIDETRWRVLVEVADKTGTRWWMWVFVTDDTVYFILSPHRSAAVVTAHLGDQPVGIASVDRYSAYKAVSIRSLLFLLAYCWAHVRRDFTTIAATIPQACDGALVWVERIAALYHANNERRTLLERRKSKAWAQADTRVRTIVGQLLKQVDQERHRRDLHPQLSKAIERLHVHRDGLQIFVEHPEIPMDNNISENALRFQVILRKNVLFNASAETAQFHVSMTSLIATLERNGMNPRTWMLDYLQHCALNGGKPPTDLDRFLPWNASVLDHERWSRPEPAVPCPEYGPPASS